MVEEFYGELMQAASMTREGKNLQYLTNILFKAAMADLHEEASGGDKDKNQHLQEFLEEFKDILPKEFLNTKTKNHESTLYQQNSEYKSLAENYTDLKKHLKEQRVYGVGKTNLEAFGTCVRNTLVTAARVVRFGVSTFVALTGVTLTLATKLLASPISLPLAYLGAAGMEYSSSSSLGQKRQDLKNNLKAMIDRPPSYEEATRASINPSPTPKPLNEKLWKRQSAQSK